MNLQNRLDMACSTRDEKAEKAIVRILKREYDRKKFGRLQVAMGKQQVLPAAQITVSCEYGPDPVFQRRTKSKR